MDRHDLLMIAGATLLVAAAYTVSLGLALLVAGLLLIGPAVALDLHAADTEPTGDPTEEDE